MLHVRVTNESGEDIEGRFDGDDFLFPQGVPVDVPEVVAMHVFGFGKPDKQAVLTRLGWLLTSDQLKAAKARLDKVRIEAVTMVGQVIEDEELPAETAAMVPERIGAASPNANAGGTKAGGIAPPANGPMKADGANFNVI